MTREERQRYYDAAALMRVVAGGGSRMDRLRARVLGGDGTADDARHLLALVDKYRERIHEVASQKDREMASLRRWRQEFEWSLASARRALRPDEECDHLFGHDAFIALLDPGRIAELQQRIGKRFLESFEWRKRLKEQAERAG